MACSFRGLDIKFYVMLVGRGLLLAFLNIGDARHCQRRSQSPHRICGSRTQTRRRLKLEVMECPLCANSGHGMWLGEPAMKRSVTRIMNQIVATITIASPTP